MSVASGGRCLPASQRSSKGADLAGIPVSQGLGLLAGDGGEENSRKNFQIIKCHCSKGPSMPAILSKVPGVRG